MRTWNILQWWKGCLGQCPQIWSCEPSTLFYFFCGVSFEGKVWYWFCCCFCSRRTEKYFRRGTRLDWPEGATSRESMRAVWKLPRLPVLLLRLVLKIALLIFVAISLYYICDKVEVGTNIFLIWLVFNSSSIVYRTLSCSMWITRLEIWLIFFKGFYAMTLQNDSRQEKL